MAVISSFSTQTTHSPEAIFAQWADPETWQEWDTGVREVSFDGPVKLGSTGRMRPASGPAVTFSITAFEPNREFTDVSTMPGATLTFEHLVQPLPKGSQVTVEVRIEGPLAPLWKRVIGRGMADVARSGVTGLLAYLDAA